MTRKISSELRTRIVALITNITTGHLVEPSRVAAALRILALAAEEEANDQKRQDLGTPPSMKMD